MEKFLQEDVVKYIEEKLGSEQWVPVYFVYNDSEFMDQKAFFSAIMSKKVAKSALREERIEWELLIGDGMPGFISHFDEGERRTEYYRFGNKEKIEPFILFRDFYGVKDGYNEVSEEFRLYHNLFNDGNSDSYIYIDEAGNEIEVIRKRKGRLEVRLKYLKEFLAAKNAVLAVFFEFYKHLSEPLEKLDVDEKHEIKKSTDYVYEYRLFDLDAGDRRASCLIRGKKFIHGLEDFEPELLGEGDEEYEEFIIDVDENGENIEYTCNPEELNNNFNSNPGKPHYLTPVFFEREVLSKYYGKDKYSVKDNRVSCSGLWGLRIDNNHPEYVVVSLGDLGKYLPESERDYWKHHNVVPDGTISETTFRRGFKVEFTDPESPDLLFKQRFGGLNEDWDSVFGWKLFRPLRKEDSGYFESLRIPLNESQEEFDSQVQSLGKVLIESLNSQELNKRVDSLEKGDKSITKLQKFLEERDAEDYEPHIIFLRNLHDLRSTGAAHRKGGDYDDAAEKFGIPGKSKKEAFEDILEKAIELIRFLDDFRATHK